TGVVITAGNTTIQNAVMNPPPNPSDATVTVIVIDGSGNPVLGDTVTITYADNSPPAVAQTDGAGNAQLTNLLVGIGATITVTDSSTGQQYSQQVSNGFASGNNLPFSFNVQ